MIACFPSSPGSFDLQKLVYGAVMHTDNSQRTRLSTWHRDAVKLHKIHNRTTIEVGWDDELAAYVIFGSYVTAEPAPEFDFPESLAHIPGLAEHEGGIVIVRPRPVDPATLPALRPEDFLKHAAPDTETGCALTPTQEPGRLPTEYHILDPEVEMKYPCSRCSRSFPSPGSLLRHQTHPDGHGDDSMNRWLPLSPEEERLYATRDTAALSRIAEQVRTPGADDVAPHEREAAERGPG